MAARAETALRVGERAAAADQTVGNQAEAAKGAAARAEEAALAAGSAAQMAAGPEGTRDMVAGDMAPELPGSAAVGARGQD